MLAEFVLVLDPARFSPGIVDFLPQQKKPAHSLFELAVGCAKRSCMDHMTAARRCVFMLSV